MEEENKKIEEKTVSNSNFGKGLAIFLSIFMLGMLLFLITQCVKNNDFTKATTNDISGDWNSTATTQSFVFIPKSNIDGLIITFSIRDKNNQELQTITKIVGDVKKGQQYTVSFNISELQDFATLMDSRYTKLSVTGGTKKLI